MKATNKDFIRIIEKRVRKHARLNKLFRKHDKIFVKGTLNKYLVPKIIKDLPCKIYYKKPKTRVNKIVIPWTLDDEINLFLKQFFTGKKIRQNPKHIKLLKPITDKEAARFAKIKKLKFKPNKTLKFVSKAYKSPIWKKEKAIQHFIDEMEKSYPDTKYKLYKSKELLKCIKKSFG